MSLAHEPHDASSGPSIFRTDDGGPLGYRGVGMIALLGLVLLTLAPWVTSWPGALPTMTALLAAAFGIAWPFYLEIPARKTLGGIIAGSGVLAALLPLVAPAPALAAWTSPVIAAGVMAVILVQLVRGTGQPQRLESTFGASAGVFIASLGAGWVANLEGRGPRDVVVVMSVCAAVALLTGLIAWPDRIVAPLGLALAALVGPLVAWFNPSVSWLPSIVTGLAAGALMLCFRRLMTVRSAGTSWFGAIGVGLAPALALGMTGYFLDKLLVI